ncbi:MAG TPA: DUF5995 family protein [Marmoricola sp.]|nr:DUF5995 family protein [Marmoricola sp.]
MIRYLAVAVSSLALLAGIGSTPAFGSGPSGMAVNPAVIDPLIGALAALPTPYKPYTGTICPRGANACIDQVIRTMQTRLRPLASSCSDNAIFGLAYLRVTENVRDANRHGWFKDPRWLNRLDALFAHMYFTTMDTYAKGGSVPPAWRVALDDTKGQKLTGLGDFMINMNAHINNDFPRALVADGLTAKNGTSHKVDHNAYNDRLDSLYGPVFNEEMRRFDPSFNDYYAGGLTGTVAGLIMRGWREMVWRNAEALANAKTPQQKALVEQWISTYALAQAKIIEAIPIFQATTASNAKRNAWCVTHHG